MGVALFSATLNAQNYPSLGKIEHFKFDNSLAGDLGGSIGGVTPTYVADRFGVPNKAQRFTEGTSNVVIQNFPTGTNSRTISFWFKGNTDIVQELFNVKGSTSGEMQISYQFPDANANSNIITVSNGNSSSNVKARLSYSNEWKQVTVVNLSGSHRIYINGVYYAMGSNSSNIAGTPVFRIGMSNTDVVSADFDMDDLIVYNRALSDLEILQVFTAPVNAPLQEWTLFQNGPGGRTFNSLEYLKRTNPGTSNQVIFSSGYTGHSGTTTVVTSNSEPRVMHETAFVTSANNTNLQVYGTDYTMDANTTLTNANNFQDEAFTCGGSWVLYYNTNNTSNRSGYWIGKIHRRIASPNATVAFNEVYSQAGRPLSDIESNKKFNGTNVIAVGKTAPTSFANGGNSFQESPVILSSINGGTNWQQIDLTSLNLGSAGLRSIKWLNQTTAIVVGYKKIVGVGFEPPTFLPLILKTTDAGLSWVDVTPNNAGLEALNFVQFSNNQLWVAGDNGKLLKSSDDGSTWTMIITDVFSSVTNIYFQDAQNGIVAGAGSYVAKTTNGGQTWRRLYFQDPARITGLEFKDATNGLIQTTAGTLYQYTPCVTLTNTINATTCGSYVSPSGNQTWTTSGQYSETLTASTGCDSIVTVNLTIINAPDAPENASTVTQMNICTGESTTLNATGTGTINWYSDANATTLISSGTSLTTPTLTNTTTYYTQINGTPCNSLITPITVTVSGLPQEPTNTTPIANQTICSWNSTTLSANGSNLTWFTSATGGNSIGSGSTFTTSTLMNNQTFYVQSATGNCASTRLAIPVTVNSTPMDPFNNTPQSNLSVCQGNGTTLSVMAPSGGATTSWWANQSGGTSIGNGNSLVLVASALLQTSTFYVSHLNGNCSSDRIAIQVVVNQPNSSIINETACGSIVINNQTFTSSGTYTQTLTNIVGCDSVITLNLTINPTNAVIVNETACESFTWIDNVTYTASTNTPTLTLTNTSGCDSLVTLNLTIYNNQTGTTNVTACGSYTWIDGNTYTTDNNTATHLLQSVNGCDSLVTLNLTFGTENSGTATISACDSYTWIDGNTYTSNTMTPTFTLTNQSGCDSLVTLNLTIKNSSSSVDMITSCDPVQWINGITYSSSTNTPTFVVLNAEGCDSVITLNLTINSVTPTITLNGSTLTTTATGGTYQWVDCANNNAAIAGASSQSFTPTMTGNYALQYTINGCTKISNCITVTLANIENLEAINWAIYPNPASEIVYFRNVKTGSQIRVLDLSGKLIYVSKFDASNNTISVANWNNGMYIVEIEHEGLINQTKLVINK